MSHFAERELAYQCFIALDALRFFAKRGDERSYRWVRERIYSLLDQSTST